MKGGSRTPNVQVAACGGGCANTLRLPFLKRRNYVNFSTCGSAQQSPVRPLILHHGKVCTMPAYCRAHHRRPKPAVRYDQQHPAQHGVADWRSGNDGKTALQPIFAPALAALPARACACLCGSGRVTTAPALSSLMGEISAVAVPSINWLQQPCAPGHSA